MSKIIPIDRETKLMLLQVLKRGGWTAEDVEKLPSYREVIGESKAEILAQLERMHKISEEVTIDESKAKELAKAGLLDFTGKNRILTEWAREVRAAAPKK